MPIEKGGNIIRRNPAEKLQSVAEGQFLRQGQDGVALGAVARDGKRGIRKGRGEVRKSPECQVKALILHKSSHRE